MHERQLAELPRAELGDGSHGAAPHVAHGLADSREKLRHIDAATILGKLGLELELDSVDLSHVLRQRRVGDRVVAQRHDAVALAPGDALELDRDQQQGREERAGAAVDRELQEADGDVQRASSRLLERGTALASELRGALVERGLRHARGQPASGERVFGLARSDGLDELRTRHERQLALFPQAVLEQVQRLVALRQQRYACLLPAVVEQSVAQREIEQPLHPALEVALGSRALRANGRRHLHGAARGPALGAHLPHQSLADAAALEAVGQRVHAREPGGAEVHDVRRVVGPLREPALARGEGGREGALRVRQDGRVQHAQLAELHAIEQARHAGLVRFGEVLLFDEETEHGMARAHHEHDVQPCPLEQGRGRAGHVDAIAHALAGNLSDRAQALALLVEAHGPARVVADARRERLAARLRDALHSLRTGGLVTIESVAASALL